MPIKLLTHLLLVTQKNTRFLYWKLDYTTIWVLIIRLITISVAYLTNANIFPESIPSSKALIAMFMYSGLSSFCKLNLKCEIAVSNPKNEGTEAFLFSKYIYSRISFRLKCMIRCSLQSFDTWQKNLPAFSHYWWFFLWVGDGLILIGHTKLGDEKLFPLQNHFIPTL